MSYSLPLQDFRSHARFVHCCGQPTDSRPGFIGEIEIRFGRTQRIAVGPKSIEIFVRIHGATDVGMISWAPLSELPSHPPIFALIRTDPHLHFSTGSESLWSSACRCDDLPNAALFNIERPKVIIVVGLHHVADVPACSGPPSCVPRARVVLGTGTISRTRHVKNDRVTMRIELEVFKIDQPVRRFVVVNQRRSPNVGDGRSDLLTINGSPCLADVARLEKVKIRAGVQSDRIRMIIERRPDCSSMAPADLIVALVHPRKPMHLTPLASVAARLPDKISSTLAVLRVQKQKSTPRNPPRLPVGKIRPCDSFESIDSMGARTSMDVRRPPRSM